MLLSFLNFFFAKLRLYQKCFKTTAFKKNFLVIGEDRIGFFGTLTHEFIAEHPFLVVVSKGPIVLFIGRVQKL